MILVGLQVRFKAGQLHVQGRGRSINRAYGMAADLNPKDQKVVQYARENLVSGRIPSEWKVLSFASSSAYCPAFAYKEDDEENVRLILLGPQANHDWGAEVRAYCPVLCTFVEKVQSGEYKGLRLEIYPKAISASEAAEEYKEALNSYGEDDEEEEEE